MASDEEEPQAFDFAQWCKDNGLTRKTEGTLSKEVLTLVDALTMLEECDIRELGLPIGQRKFLQHAVDTLRGKSANPSVSRDTGNHANAAEDPPPDVESSEADPEDTTAEMLQQPNDQEPHSATAMTIWDIRQQAEALGEAGKAFDVLLNSHFTVPASQASATVRPRSSSVSAPPALNFNDPRTILTLRAGSKATHITNFLTEQTKKRLQGRSKGIVLQANGDESVVLQTDRTHPYSGITLSEWGAANCRLMAHLLREGKLAPCDVEYYLAYTIQVYEYYEVYEWESILQFDFLYRERQCEYQFKWGYIPTNMQLSLLAHPCRKPLGAVKQSGVSRTAPAARPARGAGPTEECWEYKKRNGNCPFGDKCRYLHPAQPAPGPP